MSMLETMQHLLILTCYIQFLQSKIESGEYILGEMIVPQTFKKVTLTKEGTIKTETFTVSGRKIQLKQLGEDKGEESASKRKENLKEIERKRHLMVWGDNSTLLNHGHLLLTVNAVYDEALYYTNNEVKDRGQENIDVRSLVERPRVHIGEVWVI